MIKKKILITGATGFIGSHLTLLLKKKNYEVIVIDNLSIGKKQLFKGDKFYKVDITKKKQLEKVFKENKVFAIFHLAGLSKLTESFKKKIYIKDDLKKRLLKIAPDLNNNQLDEIIELVAETKIDGVIASNTSTTRNNLKASDRLLKEIGNGGLSGQPIKELSTRVIKYLAQNSNKAFPIIGVGGIHSAQDALDKIEAGADLVQIYTGFIYEGPGLIKQINKALLN